MSPPLLRNIPTALATSVLVAGIFACMVLWLRSDLRREIHQKIIERDAAVLYRVAVQQMAEGESAAVDSTAGSSGSLTALLKSARQPGMLAIAVFGADGGTVDAVPANQLFVELPMDDYWRLLGGSPITRYHPLFPLDQYFAGVSPEQRHAAVLEVLLPMPGPEGGVPRGFVRYYIDARPLSRELAAVDERIDRQSTVTLTVGLVLVGAVIGGAVVRLHRAQKLIAEHNERLTRANFELTLAAKVSAIGQITSHLLHGLQGSVQGLRAIVAGRDAQSAESDWQTAADYTERMQQIVQETVAILGDAGTQTSYELTGEELAQTLRERNRAAAQDAGVVLTVGPGFPEFVDSHRGALLCLIANNLIQNAIAATPRSRTVRVSLARGRGTIVLEVADEGAGIPEHIRAHLFTPGRSGRTGGSGLGLAISQLLARQLGAEITLVDTGAAGTTFRVGVPVADVAAPHDALQ